jgi:hypothetical protein
MGDVALSEQERYELGLKLGEVINLVTQVIAQLERVEQRDVFDEIVECYVAERIIDAGTG